MDLRPYQAECVDAVFQGWNDFPSQLVVMATGLGKTVVGSAAISKWFSLGNAGRVVWLAHREELIEQAAASIRTITGLPVAVEMGDSYADEYGFSPSPVVIASVQTLSRPRRRKRFKPSGFGLIITDEAHHALARSYRQIYKYFREGDEDAGIPGNHRVRHLGITATPKRSDDLAMGRVFDHVAYEYGIAAAVRDGWLVPVEQATAVVDDLDLSQVKVVNGDYSREQLEAVLTDPGKKVVLKMVRPILDHAGSRQTIVFCVSKHQARQMSDAINDARPGTSVVVTDDTPKDQRRQMIADFRDGKIQFFVNVGVATEGFDVVGVGLVAIARPTKSLTLYSQMLGRATRPLKGVVDGPADAAARKLAISLSAKPCATVLDFVGNMDRHGESVAINAADILGGNYSEAVRDYAKRAMRETPGARPVEEELDRAEAILALLAQEEERKARIVAEVDYRVRYLDSSPAGPQREQRAGRRGEPATDKQVWKLVSLGVPRVKAEKCSKAQATGWIGRLLKEGAP